MSVRWLSSKFELKYLGTTQHGNQRKQPQRSAISGSLSPSSAHPLSLIKIRDSKTARDTSQNKPL